MAPFIYSAKLDRVVEEILLTNDPPLVNLPAKGFSICILGQNKNLL